MKFWIFKSPLIATPAVNPVTQEKIIQIEAKLGNSIISGPTFNLLMNPEKWIQESTISPKIIYWILRAKLVLI